MNNDLQKLLNAAVSEFGKADRQYCIVFDGSTPIVYVQEASQGGWKTIAKFWLSNETINLEHQTNQLNWSIKQID